MANRFFNPNIQFLNDSGAVLSGGLLYFYVTGTTTPTNTYTTQALSVANANPVVLDSAGRAGAIFLDPAVTYKAVLKTSAGVTIWTADPVVDPAANVTAAFQVYAGNPNGNVAGNAGSVGGVGASVVWDITNHLLYVCTTSGVAAAAVWTQVGSTISGAVVFSGVITPSTIGADTNNYNPTSFSTAHTLRIQGSAAYKITGLTAGVAGRRVVLTNIGTTYALTLMRESSSSTAANRFALDADFVLGPEMSIALYYDNVSARWRQEHYISVAPIATPGGRLTLTTATPVLAADVTAATTIFYTPHHGLHLPLYNGTSMVMASIGAELSLALDSDAGHTGYHQSGKNFDLFVFDDAGTMRLGSSPAWSSDTARADAISRLSGFLVNTSAITLRFGSAAGNTVSVAANRATYVGTFRASANGQTEMTFAPAAAAGGTNNKLFLWNAYNQVKTAAISRDSTDSWTYTTLTLRSANNSASNRVNVIRGLNEGELRAVYAAFSANTTTNVGRGVSIGLDSTSASASGVRPSSLGTAANGIYAHIAELVTMNAGLGFHFLQALEISEATGTTTWHGDLAFAGNPIQMTLSVELMM